LVYNISDNFSQSLSASHISNFTAAKGAVASIDSYLSFFNV